MALEKYNALKLERDALAEHLAKAQEEVARLEAENRALKQQLGQPATNDLVSRVGAASALFVLCPLNHLLLGHQAQRIVRLAAPPLLCPSCIDL